MTVAVGSKACTVFCCSDNGIVSLNSTHGTDTTSACFPLLCCPVQTRAYNMLTPCQRGPTKCLKWKLLNQTRRYKLHTVVCSVAMFISI